MILRVDGTYTPSEMRQAYAEKARAMFNQNQRLRGRYSRLNTALLFGVFALGILGGILKGHSGPWFSLGAAVVALVNLMMRVTPKAVDHALSALTCLRYTQKLESMGNLDTLPEVIDAFERETQPY